MSYNLITLFQIIFHWVYTKNGCLIRAAIGVCYDVANYTRKRRNVINFKKKFSEILSFQDLILITGGYWDNKYHYLVSFPPRGETRSIKELNR